MVSKAHNHTFVGSAVSVLDQRGTLVGVPPLVPSPPARRQRDLRGFKVQDIVSGLFKPTP